jgi:hypothetical protein
MDQLSLSGKASSNRWTVPLKIGILIFLLLFCLIFYTFAHEAGHAVIGLLFGGKITSFSINFIDLSAHVGLDGQFTNPQHALISAAGVSFPLIICITLLLLTRKKNEDILYTFKAIFFLIAVNSLLAWIAIPILAISGRTIGDDSFNFLNYTHIPPLLETSVALLVYLLFWGLFFRFMGGARFWVNRFLTTSFDVEAPGTRRTILSIASAGIIVLSCAFALSVSFPDQAFTVPDGLQQVAELDLSKASFADQSVYRFSLEKPTSVRLYFLLNDVKGAPVNIRMTGPDGYEVVYLNMEDPKTTIGRASVNPQAVILENGAYDVMVSFPACQGNVKLYAKMEAQ